MLKDLIPSYRQFVERPSVERPSADRPSGGGTVTGVRVPPALAEPGNATGTDISLWHDILDEEGHASTVLLVDGVEINRRVFRAMLKSQPYRVLEAKRPSEALAILEQEKVDLVVLDLMLPEMSGPEMCRRLKSARQTRLIPILMVTSIQGTESEIAGISSGADEFLVKPLQPDVVRTRVRALLRNKVLVDSLDEAETILFALAQSVEQRDPHTGRHCQRLATYSVAIGRALGLPPSDIRSLYRGGFLHDIGKVSVPDAILFKPGKLTDEEWTIMRAHTTVGESICKPMKSLSGVLPIIRNHHERLDGTGYPDGLKGEDIPLLARVLQVADIFDALTSERSYKPALSADQAIGILRGECQRGWRDARLVEIMASVTLSDSIAEPQVDSTPVNPSPVPAVR